MAPTKRVYVSAVDNTAITLSGPPSTLSKLRAFTNPLSAHFGPDLAIYSPFHAAHLPLPDLELILGSSSLLDGAFVSHSHLISSSTGVAMPTCSTVRSIFKAALIDILERPIRLDFITQHLSSQFGATRARLVPMDHQSPPKALQCSFTEIEKASAAATQREDSYAIVGMASRFPGAKDHEALWDILLKARTMHQEVGLHGSLFP